MSSNSDAAVGGLGYLGVRSADLDGWRRVAVDALGMEVGAGSDDHLLRLKMDDHVYRVAVHEGADEGLAYQGWEVRSVPTLETVVDRLDRLGIDHEEAGPDDCAAREVGAMVRTADPDGRPVELYVGARREDVREFRSPSGTRFVTGDQGLGHVVLWTADYEASLDFWCRGLGLGVTDQLTGHFRGAFCGATARHHSVAVFNVSGVPPHVDHFMVEVDSLTAVGRAHDRALAGLAPITHTLGQHWNDRATSFYVATPSGFGIEYGWGPRRVDRTTHVTTLGNGEISFWGHHATSKEEAAKLRADTWLADLRLVSGATPGSGD